MVEVSRSGDIIMAIGDGSMEEWIRYDDKGKYRDYDSLANWS
jgi:hypothetical protein